MDNSIAVGIITAGSAIITLAVTKLYDYFYTTKAHNLELKKEYFLKKLNAFEKATTYYTITHSSVTAISNIFNTLNNDEVDFPPEIVDSMLKKVAQNLETVQQSTQDSALALGLYTDLKFTDENDLLFTRYLDVVGQINLKTQMISLINDKKSVISQDENLKNDALEEEILGEVLTLVSELVGISVKVKELHSGIIEHLREQMREFENKSKM